MSELATKGAQAASEWSPEARSLFDELMTKGPPEGLREMAEKMLTPLFPLRRCQAPPVYSSRSSPTAQA